jgi:hypothetical protein
MRVRVCKNEQFTAIYKFVYHRALYVGGYTCVRPRVAL